MNRADTLLELAKERPLTGDEADDAADLLSRATDRETQYTLLYALGRGLALAKEDLVAGYLHSPAYPPLARIALVALCSYWGLAERYYSVLRSFAHGVEWDYDEDIKLHAIGILGKLLRASGSPHIRELLRAQLQDELNNQFVRQVACEALLRAKGELIRLSEDSFSNNSPEAQRALDWCDRFDLEG